MRRAAHTKTYSTTDLVSRVGTAWLAAAWLLLASSFSLLSALFGGILERKRLALVHIPTRRLQRRRVEGDTQGAVVFAKFKVGSFKMRFA
eukprot:scaffold1534_cov267-Pinguiococcus_pyrenoidosus.AAC.19